MVCGIIAIDLSIIYLVYKENELFSADFTDSSRYIVVPFSKTTQKSRKYFLRILLLV